MTFLHGDDRFYNNIFVRSGPVIPSSPPHDSDDGHDEENREVGTHVWDEYPTYDEWIAQFDMDTDTPNMMKLARAHDSHCLCGQGQRVLQRRQGLEARGGRPGGQRAPRCT